MDLEKLNTRDIRSLELFLNQLHNKGTDCSNADLLTAIEIALKLKPSNVIEPIRYDEIKNIDADTLNFIMFSMGLYTFPTVELIEWLNEQIDEYTEGYEPAIEICAGTGWIGRGLGIPITDAKIQDIPEVKEHYQMMGQPTIDYPDDVEPLEAISAIKKYNPEYVIGSYVTSKYGLKGSSKKRGNMYGVNTLWVTNHCHKYFLIGNDDIHAGQPEMKRPHKRLSFPWLITRGNSDHARIYIWENKHW